MNVKYLALFATFCGMGMAFATPSITSVTAQPRYPWNGKVDIDCEVKGDANRQYLISLEAIDLDGGTNLLVRSVVGRAVPGEPQPAQLTQQRLGGTPRPTPPQHEMRTCCGRNLSRSIAAKCGSRAYCPTLLLVLERRRGVTPQQPEMRT